MTHRRTRVGLCILLSCGLFAPSDTTNAKKKAMSKAEKAACRARLYIDPNDNEPLDQFGCRCANGG
jgi:hypothetical protein